MIPNSPFSCDILCLHGCCCRFACPQVYEAGEGTHRRRRLTPGRGHQEGTIGSGSGRLSESSPERKGKNGIQGRGKSLCRWPEGVKIGKPLGEDWRT